MNANTQKTQRRIRGILQFAGIAGLCILLFAAFVCFFAARWYVAVYGRVGFDSVLYTLTSSLGGVQSGLIVSYLTGGLLPAVYSTAVVCLLLFFPWHKYLKLTRKRWISVCLSLIFSAGLLTHAAFNVELVDYLMARNQETTLFDKEYRDPKSVQITFPEEKRNLIYIMLESMETTYQGPDQAGGVAQNLIPELTQLALENVNFSQNDGVGGFQEVPGSGWTIGAMVAQSAGVPLKTPADLADRFNGYGKDGVFLPGLTSLNSILQENGYYQALMVGSDIRFGGRDVYYNTHGMDRIYDLYTARADGIVPDGYYVWWGMEDKHLFAYAKQELTAMAAMDQPFAFTMLTVDTHHIGGYKCTLCGSDHEENYDNVIACSSRQVADFIQWIQQQDFYENTTIVVVGDHRSMDNGYFTRNVEESYTRRVYNCFINAAATPVNPKNREFTTVDLFPTTLAAMGCTIEGNRLGLGTNLFSPAPTLAERMGYEAFCQEAEKESQYYADHFFTAD